MTEVVTLGECLVAFVATTPGPLAEATTFERFVVGAEANVAVGLARLGHSVAFIGRVGADGFGEAIARRLRGEGVDISDLVIDPDAPTGLMFRERRVLGPAQVVYARSGSAGSRLAAAEVERALARHTDSRWLHLTGITPALSDGALEATTRAIESGRAAGATISLDLNLRRRLWSDEAAAPVLRGLAAGVDVDPRQPGRTGGPDTAHRRSQPSGAGTGDGRSRAIDRGRQAGGGRRPRDRARRPG